MARKVPVLPEKFVAPKKEDSRDKRCAFVTKHDVKEHSRITFKQWCHGCGYYVCENCIKEGTKVPLDIYARGRTSAAHSMSLHQPDEDNVDVN